jgi:hypothetical protein
MMVASRWGIDFNVLKAGESKFKDLACRSFYFDLLGTQDNEHPFAGQKGW